MEDEAKLEISERLADLRRRRSEAADVIAEALLDMWRNEQRAKRSGAWTPPPEPKPDPVESPRLVRGPDTPTRRVFRDIERADRDTAMELLRATWFPVEELDVEPPRGMRRRMVFKHGRTLAGVAILDDYGHDAVLRAVVIRPTLRRRKHGSALVAALVRRAWDNGVSRIFAAAPTPWFVEELGFEHRKRAELSESVKALPGLIDAPARAHFFEMTPSAMGTRAPRRMVPKSALEFLAQRPEVKIGRRPGRPRKQKGHDEPRGDHER